MPTQPETCVMTPGRSKSVTAEQVLDVFETRPRPVWSASDVADATGVSRPTATDRLKELAEQNLVKTIEIGNTTAYYVPDGDDLDLAEFHAQRLAQEFENRFVGLSSAPWTAIHPNDGPAEAGDKVQIRVEGLPGDWRQGEVYHWDERIDEWHVDETSSDESQALISGELYARPTVPIEHVPYPDDYDLEANIGAKIQDAGGRSVLIASGVKNYLIRPCNDAVFIKNVSVDWLSPQGEGPELETYGFDTLEEAPGGEEPDEQ